MGDAQRTGVQERAVSEVAVRSATPPPARELLAPTRVFRDLWRHRGLLARFTAREVHRQYRATSLGMAWAGVQPILLFAVYAFVFTQIFPSRWERPGGTNKTAEVALLFFLGFVIFRFAAEAANDAPNLVINKRAIVQRVVFPLEVLPAAALGKHLLVLGIGLALVLIGSVAFGVGLRPTALLVVPVLIPLILLTLGVVYALSALGVYLRDLGQGVGVVTRMLLFLTPVFYPLDRVPEGARPLIELNPLTGVVMDARRTVLLGRTPDWASLGLLGAVSVVVLISGYALFLKAKRGFSDVL